MDEFKRFYYSQKPSARMKPFGRYVQVKRSLFSKSVVECGFIIHVFYAPVMEMVNIGMIEVTGVPGRESRTVGKQT